MLWKSGNVELRIWPLDHCPPHVTAVCRADAWTARIEFSMVTDAVSLWDIKPKKNAPTWTVIRRLAGQVFKNRLACREAWWQMQKTVCLDNVPIGRRGKSDVVLLPAGTVGQGTVVKGSGIYIPGQSVQARVHWGASTTLEWLKEA
ncbi:MAG: hypothetical protein QM740_20120 [Acidovorax sp.]